MKYRKAIMRVGITTLMAGCMAASPLIGQAATAPMVYSQAASHDVFITEMQAASTTSGSEEFVELYNNTASDIDLADVVHAGKDAWKLQYYLGTKFDTARTASPLAWGSATGTIGLTGVIPAHDYYVLASNNYAPGSLEADQNYSPHLSNEVALQLIDVPTTTSTVIHDQMQWSDSTTKQGGAGGVLVAPIAGNSLQRQPNDDDGYVDSDGLLTDFISDKTISPKSAWVAPEPIAVVDPVPTAGDPVTDPIADDSSSTPEDPTTPTGSTTNSDVLPVITELLPNPASPQTDADDEFIELHNPSLTDDFNLKGYTLEVGTSTLHDFTFTSDTVLLAGGYMAFTSAQTGLALSNSGGQVKLLSPTGIVIAQSSLYTTAADGQAWALDSGDSMWHWTATPTPGSVNAIAIAADTASMAAVTKTTTKTVKKAAKTAAIKGTKTTKVKKAKVAKKAKTKKAAAKLTSSYTATTEPPKTPIHPWTLAVVGGLAVLYGLYEYRLDLANRFYQLRKHRTSSRSTRYSMPGR